VEVTPAVAPPPFIVTEPSQIGEARRRALDLGASAGLDPVEQGKLALVIH
jgi:hypothetical protein